MSWAALWSPTLTQQPPVARPALPEVSIEDATLHFVNLQPEVDLPVPRPSRTRRSRGRLTRAPGMIGDFFGSTAGGTATVTNFIGRAVHYTASANDLHLIIENGTTTFVGGPGSINAFADADLGLGFPTPPLGDQHSQPQQRRSQRRQS